MIMNSQDEDLKNAWKYPHLIQFFALTESQGMIMNIKDYVYSLLAKPINHGEKEMTIYNDDINHPSHYNSSPCHCECGRKIECIDITRYMNFNIGNIIKHLWRAEFKGGLQDLKKAQWYMNDEVNRTVSDQLKLQMEINNELQVR